MERLPELRDCWISNKELERHGDFNEYYQNIALSKKITKPTIVAFFLFFVFVFLLYWSISSYQYFYFTPLHLRGKYYKKFGIEFLWIFQ